MMNALWLAECSEVVKTDVGSVLKVEHYCIKASNQQEAETIAQQLHDGKVLVRLFEEVLSDILRELDRETVVYVHL